jgi:hypothetical protein
MDQLHLVDLPGRGIPEASRIVVSVLAPSKTNVGNKYTTNNLAFLWIDISSDRSKDHLNE